MAKLFIQRDAEQNQGNSQTVGRVARDLLAPLLREKRVALLVFVGILLALMVSLLLLPKTYEAHLKVLLVQRPREHQTGRISRRSKYRLRPQFPTGS